MKKSKEEVVILVNLIKNGNVECFPELVALANNLLVSLSNRFCSYHRMFDFDDFYSIGLFSLYKACLSFNDRNPSFFNYARICIFGDFCREMKKWSAERRNIFKNQELYIEDISGYREAAEHETFWDNFFALEFSHNLKELIYESFNEQKSNILKMYLLEDYRIIEISNITGLRYKNVYSIITRGVKKLENDYAERYIP
jgi:RNA polymerase sigma factor (sigma-70 family)